MTLSKTAAKIQHDLMINGFRAAVSEKMIIGTTQADDKLIIEVMLIDCNLKMARYVKEDMNKLEDANTQIVVILSDK